MKKSKYAAHDREFGEPSKTSEGGDGFEAMWGRGISTWEAGVGGKVRG